MDHRTPTRRRWEPTLLGATKHRTMRPYKSTDQFSFRSMLLSGMIQPLVPVATLLSEEHGSETATNPCSFPARCARSRRCSTGPASSLLREGRVRDDPAPQP